MADKIFTNVRLGLKVDTLENWNSSSLPLKRGEVAFATVAASAGAGLTKPVVMMKIGEDGVKTFKDIEWNFYAKASDVLAACKSEDALKTFVNGVIADAGIATNDAMEALAGRVTTAEGEIDTLQSEMDAVEAKAAANETAIGVNAAAIAALEGLVGDTKVATQISNAIAALDLANTYEAKGEAAKVQTALETYKTSNDAAVQKNASDLSGEIARAKAAEEANAGAITAIKDGTTIDSFADVEAALAGKQATGDYATKAEAQAMADAKDDAIAEAKKAGTDAAAAAAAAQADVDALEALVGDTKVSEQISSAITDLDLANTYAAKVHTHVKADITDFAHNHEMAEVNGLVDALAGKQAVGDYATKAEAQGYANAKDEDIAAALKAGQDAQADVDALEIYVGTIPSDEKYADITNVVAYINKKAEETLASAQGGSSETAASVLAALNTYKAENDPKVQANTDAIDAIEADYLKAADKTELADDIAALEALVGDTKVSDAIATAVAAEETRAKGVESGLETRLATVEGDYLKAADKTELQNQITTNANAIERLTNGVSAEEVDGVNDLIQYVKDHGTEVTGMKADIKVNADAIDAIEADYLKAADKTELSGLITGLDTRMGAAETAIGTKAAQADLETLAGRVTTVEGDLNTETTGLKARMTQAEADIDALETKVGDETVAAQIEAAIEALKIGDYAKAADLTAAIEQHNTDKAALEAEIAKKANDADLAAIAKSGSTDDLVQGELVLIFDCGTSV